MSLAITHLGSGSRGNATLLATDETKVLIDCGLSGKQLELRLGLLSIKPTELDGIYITHHHTDHSSGAAIAHRRWDIPLHCNFETCAKLGFDPVNEVELFEPLQRIQAGPDLSLLPVSLEHSGADNVGFIAHNCGDGRAAVITDLGSWSDDLVRHLSSCSHISIEANYDSNRLLNGPYPQRIKERIASRGGHLSNRQTADLLVESISDSTRSIVLAHLSEQNNRPHLAESEILYQIGDYFGGDLRISLARGPEFTHWLGQTEAERISING
jgi:phosphoribosyl 1,2-cyclic phosphodiesterase